MKNKKTFLLGLLLAGLLGVTFTGCDVSGNSDSVNSNVESGTPAASDSVASDSSSDGTKVEQKKNAITGLSYTGDVYCGMEIPALNATATYGTVVYTYAMADGETAKEDLTYQSKEEILAADPDFVLTEGTYYVKATVAETEEYEGVTEYASLTVAHKTYAEVTGEPESTVAPVADGNVKGYSVKKCTCGEELQGDYTVLVSVKLNGADYATQTVKVGDTLGTLALPVRDGYTLKLYKDGEEYTLNETFDDFATLELTSRWIHTETNYDYKTDAEAKIAALPATATAENAENVLEQIAAIEAIVNAHYTDEEKTAMASSVAALKEAAETIVSAPEYQLNKRLAAIPEFEDMTDEVETLYAVLDYITYFNGVKDTLVNYSEPRKISIYKHYFSGEYTLVKNVNEAVETNAVSSAEHGLVLEGAANNEYTFTLPKIPYATFTKVRTIVTLGEGNKATGYTFKAYDTTLVDAASKSWFWVEVTAEADGVYLSIYDTDLTSGEKVALPEAVANGQEGLTFTLTTAGAWDWMKFRQDGSVAADNVIGELGEFEETATVRTVTYSYKDGAGEQTLTQYYLDGESLALPELSVSYTDKVGTHTLSGWGETADVVTGDLVYTATYETEYKNYTVTFLDASNNVFEVKEDYRYGDKLVLPTATPEKAKEGSWRYEFIGWYNDEEEVNGETLVEKNMEITPQFKAIYDGECYVLTIESAGLETQTYNVPALTELQAEALSEVPATLERAGYEFAGYTDKETNEEVDLTTLRLSADKTIVANWTAKYVSMAAELPATVEAITDEEQTYADLIAYLTYVVNNPVDDYEEPANVTALKAHYASARKIYTFTSTDDSNISTSAGFEKVEDKADTWYQDDQGNAYGGYIQATFDKVDGESTVVLPKINYALYSEVSFSVFGLGAANAVQLSINGNGATLDNTGNVYYVVEIQGKNLEVHNMNGVDTLFTATLTDAQYNGTEGLTLTVTESGWSCLQISHILGALAVSEESEEPEEPETPEVVSPTAISGVMTSVTTNATYESGNGLVMTGAADNTYTFTLSKVKFSNYTEVSMITVFGQANKGYTFTAYGTTFANTGIGWNWLKVVKVGAEGKTVKNTTTGEDLVLAEGYYLAIGNTDVGAEWYTYVKLSDAVVNGEEGLTFSVTTSEGAWDWMKFRQDGSVETDNFVGTLA